MIRFRNKQSQASRYNLALERCLDKNALIQPYDREKGHVSLLHYEWSYIKLGNIYFEPPIKKSVTVEALV